MYALQLLDDDDNDVDHEEHDHALHQKVNQSVVHLLVRPDLSERGSAEGCRLPCDSGPSPFG